MKWALRVSIAVQVAALPGWLGIPINTMLVALAPNPLPYRNTHREECQTTRDLTVQAVAMPWADSTPL
ncbi:hypothetical protein WT97_07735 [Burkholderia sp. MSMB1459WGS]|nr:hypothetical protein WT97_07735 [Burkholderia sp. MSMB1459WGS]